MGLADLYQEVLLDHYKNPRHKVALENPSSSCALYNPLCGDQVNVAVTSSGEKIDNVGFCGHGCSISQASCSIVCDLSKGKSAEEICKLCERFRLFMRGEIGAEQIPELGDAVALEGVRKFSARVKCAMLAWEAMEKCATEVIEIGQKAA